MRLLAGDLGSVIEATSTGGRRSDFFTAGKLAPDNLGLLQQYLHRSTGFPSDHLVSGTERKTPAFGAGVS